MSSRSAGRIITAVIHRHLRRQAPCSRPLFVPAHLAASSIKRHELNSQRVWMNTGRSNDGDETKGTLPPEEPIQRTEQDVDQDTSWADWIPPDRPLAGDQGQSHLYPLPSHHSDSEKDYSASDSVDNDEEKELLLIEQELQRLEAQEADEEDQGRPEDDDDLAGVDWLKTRRQALGGGNMVPADHGQVHRDQLIDIEVKQHKLLSKDEIATILSSLGGKDITVIMDNPADRRMGGIHGMIVCTGMNPSQLRVMADSVVRQLRLRQLHQFNVVGAKLGVEGADNDNWLAVDCRNYVVHLQEETTREMVDLVGLWSSNLNGRQQLNHLDDDAVDDFVARNPIPEGYGDTDWSHPTWMQLEKNRWTAPHRPVIPIHMKAKRSAKKRNRLRRR